MTAEAALVAAQLGRQPRGPWRVAARCAFGRPVAIVSPPVLADGTPFPTWAWLTCPHLTALVAGAETAGAAAQWTGRASADLSFAAALLETDARLKEARAAEGHGDDPCSATGLGGQRDPLKVKCLHVHVALSVCGINDPIGQAFLGEAERECADDDCARLAPASSGVAWAGGDDTDRGGSL